jgi:hypothetical protein
MCCCFLFYLRHGTSAKEKVSASIISSVLLLSFHLRHGTSAKEKVSASIISSVLLLSFHLRQGTSAKEKVFYYFFCLVAFFLSSPRYERQRKENFFQCVRWRAMCVGKCVY